MADSLVSFPTNIFVCKKKWTKNSNTSISRFNHQSTELQIGKPLSLKAAIMMSVNELLALILFRGLNWSNVVSCLCRIVASEKRKHLFWNEILFIRDIKSFNGDGNFILILYFSTSPASWFLSSFFFLFFFPSFLESRLVGFYFEGHLKGGPLLFLFLSL